MLLNISSAVANAAVDAAKDKKLGSSKKDSVLSNEEMAAASAALGGRGGSVFDLSPGKLGDGQRERYMQALRKRRGNYLSDPTGQYTG